MDMSLGPQDASQQGKGPTSFACGPSPSRYSRDDVRAVRFRQRDLDIIPGGETQVRGCAGQNVYETAAERDFCNEEEEVLDFQLPPRVELLIYPVKHTRRTHCSQVSP